MIHVLETLGSWKWFFEAVSNDNRNNSESKMMIKMDCMNFLFIFSLLLLLSLHRIMVVGESKIYRRENDRSEVVFVLSFLLLLKWSSWRQSDRYGSHRR